jgi:hypothetical protein
VRKLAATTGKLVDLPADRRATARNALATSDCESMRAFACRRRAPTVPAESRVMVHQIGLAIAAKT